MNRLVRLALVTGIVSGLALLAMLAWSTGNASRVADHYDILLALNGIFAFALFVWVIWLLVRMTRQLRRRQFGARMTARFALAFALIGVLPGALIYMISVQFMSRSIESWFNVRINSALEAGLNLGRAALDTRLADLEARARLIAAELNNTPDANIAVVLTRLRQSNAMTEATVFTGSGRMVAFSTSMLGQLLPERPSASITNRLRVSRRYATIEADDLTGGQRLTMRVVVPLADAQHRTGLLGMGGESRWLQVLKPVPDQIASNAAQVQAGFRDYQELALSRTGLRKLYGITLTLALLLAVFGAIAVALSLSRRLVRPLLTLAAGTQAVSVGDFRPLPEPARRDEIAHLTRSFNAMTHQLDEARRQVETNRQQLERSNLYLESVLANLSSGVLVFDEKFCVTTVNRGAQRILRADLRVVIGRPLATVAGMETFASIIRQAFAAHAAVGSERTHWQQQFEITLDTPAAAGDTQTLTLLARGTHLSVDGRGTGYLVVFDDITEVISANRTVAWGEVARRLAHEIKNPLTPIQLSAERLAMKLAGRLEPADARILARSTGTIINQVSSLKKMVDDFREYARTPPAVMQRIDFNALVSDVLTLYGWDQAEGGSRPSAAPRFEVALDASLPPVEGDPTQLRQVIHNLLSNARDAVADQQGQGVIRVATRLVMGTDQDTGRTGVRLTVSDSGPGFTQQVLARATEPYVTTKPHGTGLGLAIVHKIVEEHGASLDIDNHRDGGAKVSIWFSRIAAPLPNPLQTAPRQGHDNAVTQ